MGKLEFPIQAALESGSVRAEIVVMSDLSSSVRVVEAPGRLPNFWDRNTIFMANLLALFFGNEEETRMLADQIGELDSYGGRLIPIIDLLFGENGNLLVLERAPNPDLCEYFGETLGLSLPEIEILPHAEYLEIGSNGSHPFLEKMAKHESAWIDGYVTDDILALFASRIGKQTVSTTEGSRLGNNKRLLHQFLEANGLPVVYTELAANAEELKPCLAKLLSRGFSAGVIKASIGASGIGLLKVDSLNDCDDIAERVPDHFFFEGPCLVQGWLNPGELGVRKIRSPSVQLFLNDDSVTQYDLTEQILSDLSVHEGNESPPPYLGEEPGLQEELLRQGGIAGQWLHEQGYRGTASADFLVVDYEDHSEVYVCEINARVTGATYPSVLARRFIPDGAWLLRNLRFTEPLSGRKLLDTLRDSHDLFIPGHSESGIIPVNFNYGSDGLIHKGQFLCLAHSTAGSHVLLNLAEIDLPCAPDRD